MKVFFDCETRSAAPIKFGAHKYAEHCEICIITYAVGEGPVEVLDFTSCTDGPDLQSRAKAFERLVEQWDRFLAVMANPELEVWAHNAGFDRVVLSGTGFRRQLLGMTLPTLNPPRVEAWRCSMVLAYTLSLPGALGDLCSVLGVPLDESKLGGGKDLVKLFCQPARIGANKGHYNSPETHPREWQEYLQYADRDVVAMRSALKRMPTWNYQGEWLALWHLDQRINDRGYQIDLDLVDSAIALCKSEQTRLRDEVSDQTYGEVDSATQTKALKEHLLREYGVDLPDMRKSTLERRLADERLDAGVRELLRIRLDAAMSSVTKYKVLADGVNSDGRMRGTLQYRGASRTGRWAGRRFQPQNLPRVPRYLARDMKTGIGVEAIKLGCADMMYDKPMQVASSAIRGALVAPPGKRLVVADLSNIEGRMLAWIAGETWKIRAFREYDQGLGHDMYCLSYSRSFGDTPEAVAEDDKRGGNKRQVGKVLELACGYQGSVGAYRTMAAVYGLDDMDEGQIRSQVEAWRKANRRIVALWYDLERACKDALQSPGMVFQPVPLLKVKYSGSWLRIRLPSGRCLVYPKPRLCPDTGQLQFMGVDPYCRKWMPQTTYGGKLVENVIQGASADCLSYGMMQADPQGYEVVLHVHDELITECPDEGHFNHNGLSAIMAENPPWAAGLPLAAAGFTAYRYRK